MDKKSVRPRSFGLAPYASMLLKILCASIAGACAGRLIYLAQQLQVQESPLAIVCTLIVCGITPYMGYCMNSIRKSPETVNGAVKFDFLFWLSVMSVAGLAVLWVFYSVSDSALYTAIGPIEIICICNLIVGMSTPTKEIPTALPVQ